MEFVPIFKISLFVLSLQLSCAEWVEIPQNSNVKNKDSRTSPKIKPIVRFTTNPTNMFTSHEIFKKPSTTSKPINEPKLVSETKTTPAPMFFADKNKTSAAAPNPDVPNLDSAEKTAPLNRFGLSGLMPYIEHLQEKVLKHLPKGVTNKIHMLETYRDNLFVNIEQRVRRFWPALRTRQRRTVKEHHDDDHMEFPSAEGALMTISFLTFSLFLTKLVLQVIQVLKAKGYNTGTPTTYPMGFMTAGNIKQGRNARRFSASDMPRYEHVLRSISPTWKYN